MGTSCVYADKIEANFKNAVLTSILPKTTQAQKNEKKSAIKRLESCRVVFVDFVCRNRSRATLSVHLLQVGLGLREFGPDSAVGEFNQLRVIAARGGRIPDRSCRSRRARIAA
jgi:hypothetical protein